jgi:protein TonB
VFRLPSAERRGWRSTVASVLLHAIIIALVFMPSDMMWIDPVMEGAGGAGPAGGGGGGRRGTGGDRNAQERIRFYAAPQAIPVPQVVPPIIEKKPEVVPPPVVQPPPVEAPKVDTSVKVADATEVKSPVTGTGGGTGNDTTGGTGPGTGGGKGSGVGTGTGSDVGPGTGGGFGTVYPPTITTMVILPTPVPSRARPYKMVACFEVDSLSRARLLHFTESKDASYTRKVRESLLGYKFRAAVRASDGQPVRDTTCINASAG